MSNTWILVADTARARLFENSHRDDPLRPLGDFINPEARMPGRRSTHDHPPTVHESVGPARHSIEPHTTLRDRQRISFARELVDKLEQGRVSRRYDRLVLVAPPKFLGVLHQLIQEPLRQCIVGESARDITARSCTTIHERIAPLLEPSTSRPATI